jgi:hypothetical protein
MEQEITFYVNHIHIEMFIPINNFDDIPICLCIVCHESFEINVDTIHEHDLVKHCQQDILGFYKLWLHVVNNNGHEFIVSQVVNMTCHSGPSLHVHDMIDHHPRILQITTKLHALDQIHTKDTIIHKYLKEEHLLIWHLSKETTILNVFIMIFGFQQKYVVNVTSINSVLEQGNDIRNVGKVQGKEVAHHFVQLVTL